MRQHNWSGWPGAICLDCLMVDPWEVALADNVYDPIEDSWDMTKPDAAELKKLCLETPCPGKKKR